MFQWVELPALFLIVEWKGKGRKEVAEWEETVELYVVRRVACYREQVSLLCGIVCGWDFVFS